MNENSSALPSPVTERSSAHRRGTLYKCFYWTLQAIYGAFAAFICCVVFAVIVAIVAILGKTVHITWHPPAVLFVVIPVVSILVGIRAAYRNHLWIQRRELAKRNA